GVVDFGDKSHVGVKILDLRYHPTPEFYRHHFRHITTEAVNLLLRPENEDVLHLQPSVGHRIKVGTSATLYVYPIIQFYRFKPICDEGVGPELIVARWLGGYFFKPVVLHWEFISPSGRTMPRGRDKSSTGKVVEIVTGTKRYGVV